ncbi:hypothetical protein OPV22_013037 [Ensete ventricosum]|uniref:Uncharacterized protein n=1 Tax=Ensete ventricosum TaxID=4639 RepID=A0AAV8R2Z3_ENSVE|nr:hypothetical protein OPV22_013037 [Ensete ventricosum]
MSHSTAGEKRDTEGSKQKKPAFLEIERIAEIIEDFKMVLVIRIGLKMGKRKIVAFQCMLEKCGQVKVVLKIQSDEDRFVLQDSSLVLRHNKSLLFRLGYDVQLF